MNLDGILSFLNKTIKLYDACGKNVKEEGNWKCQSKSIGDIA